MKKPLAMDLFAGAGGMSLGLERAGFQCIGAFEWNDQAASTYRHNLGRDLVVSGFGSTMGDLSRIDPRQVARRLSKAGIKRGEIDLLAAGPPCQGFSRIGRGKLNSLTGKVDSFLHDPRNQLYRRALEFVGVLEPKAILLENVPGILHLSGTNIAEVICKALEDIGYSVRYTLLNAARYGVPQSRERVFILGIRRDLAQTPPLFPRPTHHLDMPRGTLSRADLRTGDFLHPEFYAPFSECLNLSHNKALPAAISTEAAIGDLPVFTEHLRFLGKRGLPNQKGYSSKREFHEPLPYKLNLRQANQYQRQMRKWLPLDDPGLVTGQYGRWVPRDFMTFRKMRSGDCYTQAVEIAKGRYREAVEAYRNGDWVTRPKKKDFIPPYSTESFDEKWKKLYRTRPSWTVTAHLERDTYSHIHYDSRQARAISPREAARLQSFPDGFVFTGNTGDMFRQIGNAVPPLLALALGNFIREQIEAAEALDLEPFKEPAWPA